jgi:predicted nuclease with TOPRIM domain
MIHRLKSGDGTNKQSSAMQIIAQRDEIQLYKDENFALHEKNLKLKRGVKALNLINENLEREASALIESHKDLDNQVKNLRKRLSKDEACIIA